MDMHCSTCGEPWDTYHLRHDAIWETSLGEEEIKAWIECSTKTQLNERYRDKFREAGWEFGATVLNVRRCPCCPKDARTDTDTDVAKTGIEETLGDDTDGLAATFEDFGF